jgi:hypothetical protein
MHDVMLKSSVCLHAMLICVRVESRNERLQVRDCRTSHMFSSALVRTRGQNSIRSTHSIRSQSLYSCSPCFLLARVHVMVWGASAPLQAWLAPFSCCTTDVRGRTAHLHQQLREKFLTFSSAPLTTSPSGACYRVLSSVSLCVVTSLKCLRNPYLNSV